MSINHAVVDALKQRYIQSRHTDVKDSIVKSNIASIYDTTGRTITSGVRLTVTFDTIDFDPKGLVDAGMQRIYFRHPGYYLCGANCGIIDSASGGYQFIILINYNGGSSNFICMQSVYRESTKNVYASVSGIYRASAGDYIDLRVQQDSGGNRTTNNNWKMTSLWVAKLH